MSLPTLIGIHCNDRHILQAGQRGWVGEKRFGLLFALTLVLVPLTQSGCAGLTSAAGSSSATSANSAPSITIQPASQTVAVGQTATFSVTASGTAPLTYQWKSDGAPVGSAISATYATPATTTSESGTLFTVVVSNSMGTATSTAATLTVNAPAAAITLTATHLTMEQGEPVPPLIWTQSAYPTTCTGYPTLITAATSSSTPGTYPISASAGTFACTGYTNTYTGNNLVVIADDGNGAQINNSVTYPPGFTSGPSTNPAINVTSNSTCDMVGDGVTDNTTCLNSLFALYAGGNCGAYTAHSLYLYFPAGIYLTSGQLSPCGNYWVLFGSGPQSSVIRLAPDSAAFNTGTNTQWINPTSLGGNNNFAEFIYNMGLDVGYGNPNAIPYTTDQNNVGAERNVIIWSEDGNCPYAVNMSDNYPGPALFKNVAVYGCVNAIYTGQTEYSWTFDQITTEGQTGTVLNTGAFKISVQHWLGDNATTALAIADHGAVSVLDSELLNGGGSTTGITVASGGSAFVRNVTLTGYSPSEVDTGTGTPVTYTGNLTQNWTGTAQSLWNSAQTPSSLYLPEQETPLPTDDPIQSDWTELGSTLSSWCSSITDSTSATVYAPPGEYAASGSAACSIPGNVNHLEFYGADAPNFKFTFTVSASSSTPLVIDGCGNSPLCAIVHAGLRTVVLTDSAIASYTASSSGAGNLFLEDVVNANSATPTFAFTSAQSVWGRQLDLEDIAGNTVACDGCVLWVLGYKNESSNPATMTPISLTSGAKAEIFTAFLYPLGTAGSGTFPISLANSSFFISSAFSFVNVNGYDWQYWLQDAQGGNLRRLAMPSQNANDYILNMYY